MKKLLLFTGVLLCVASCSKKDAIEQGSNVNYQVRIAAVDNNGAKTYTQISRVKSGKVAIEFETADVSGVKEFDVEESADGVNFHTAKIIAVDASNPNKMYRDSIALD